MSFDEVSSILWRERQLLELLLFKLEEEQLLLAAGRTRWLSHATREVSHVLQQLKHCELQRAIDVEALAGDLHLMEGPTLAQLVAAAPAPWAGILADHRQAFLTLTQEISVLAHTNRDLLNRGAAATRDALSWLGGQDGEPELYSASGTSEPTSTALLLNRVM